jgi:SAM-dependent methyltransferase
MERLALDRFSSPWLRNQHLVRYRWAAGFARGRRVLDAACGTGYGSRLISEAGASRVVSVDVSPDAPLEAERSDDLRHLRFVRADVARLPFRSGAFDLYVSFETLEHVAGDEDLVEEARRMLAPGGMFLCSTPNRDLLSPGLTLDDRPRNPYHVREYSIAEFDSLLRRFFAEVTLLGQTWFSEAHRKVLARAGGRSNGLAVRIHQLTNLARLPLERPERHQPSSLSRAGAPEVVVAICQSAR